MMLGDRLRSARHARFVGRTAEKTIFESAITAPDPDFHILHIFGPGGVGKTNLLQEFGLICDQHKISYAYLDVRNVEATPDAFTTSLKKSVGAQVSLQDHLSAHSRYVILVDTYETLMPLDDWMREFFLPQMPENTLVVLAGREEPGAAWRADPGWQTLMHSISLRNLESNESADYLTRRNVPDDQHQAVLNFTHGHPLALSLVADVFAQRPDFHFQPEDVPDMVRTLVAQFVQKVPGPAHRAALEACALVRLTTESLLAEMLAVQDASELFDWLQGLSFIERGQEGVFPHDLAREALATDVRWRNPEWYAELHKRARQHYFDRFQQTSGAVQQRILTDYIFLHRDNPLVRPFFEWQTGIYVIADSMQSGDLPILVEMVRRHEGDESGKLASYWLSRQSNNVLVMRDSRRKPVGFVMMLALQQTSPEDGNVDPAVRAAQSYLQNHTPLRPGEVATMFRFWMAEDTYQEVGPVQTQIFVNMVRHYLLTPRLAFTFLPCSDADFWLMPFSYADVSRLPQVDYSIDGKRFGVYGHDWRIVPPIPWLELMGEREVTTSANGAPPPPTEQVLVLSEADFADAVQDTLRDYVRPDVLKSSPLLRSKLVIEKAGFNSNESERVNALRALLKEAAESLQQSAREAKFYRPLYHTYFQPAPTQEQAAELLDLPFSSYRRHLKSGITRVTEILWAREIGATEKKN